MKHKGNYQTLMKTTSIRISQANKRYLEKLRKRGQSLGDVVSEAIKVLFFQRMNDGYREQREEADYLAKMEDEGEL